MNLYIAERRTLTTKVGDLVAELLKFDQGAYIYTEGCDCIGNVVCVTQDSNGDVLIERDDYAFGNDDTVVEKYKGRVVEPSNSNQGEQQ